MVQINKTEDFKEVPITDEFAVKFCQQSIFKAEGLSRVEPYNHIFPSGRYTKHHKHIEDFEVFEDDIWVCTHPKSGTTWATEIVWCLKNNLDFVKAKAINLDDRVPFFETSLVDEAATIDENNLSFDKPLNMQRPRVIKSHLIYEMLPKQVHEKKVKIINVIRNPRDVCLSYYNHCKLFDNYTGDQSTITNMMLNDSGYYFGPFFPNVLSYWKRRNEKNILVLSFDDMKNDLPGVVKKMAHFLDVKITEDGMQELCAHTHFDSMKNNPMVNKSTCAKEIAERWKHGYEGNFIHKGKSGGWKDRFDETTIKRFEEWETKWLKDTGLSFKYD